jgi:hypothetical protein
MAPSDPDQFWLTLEARFEAGEVVLGEVVGHHRGGLVVTTHGKRGVVPLSQIVELPAELRRGGADSDIATELQAMLGAILPLYIIEMNWRRDRLILSQRRRPPRPTSSPPPIPPSRGDDAPVHARLPKRPISPADHAMAVPEE